MNGHQLIARARGAERTLFGVLGIALLVGTWEALTATGAVDPIMISSPSAIISDANTAFGSAGMWDHTWTTLGEWVIGFSLAAAAGVPLGIVAARSRIVGKVTEHWLLFLLIVPMVALVPLFILVLGIGVEMKVLISFLTALPPIALNVLEGVRATSPDLLNVGNTFGANRFTALRAIYLPSALPSLLAGVRIGSAQALIGVVFAEMVASSAGLGYAIKVAGSTFNTPRLMLGIIILAIMAIVVGKSLEMLERRLERWRV